MKIKHNTPVGSLAPSNSATSNQTSPPHSASFAFSMSVSSPASVNPLGSSVTNSASGLNATMPQQAAILRDESSSSSFSSSTALAHDSSPYACTRSTSANNSHHALNSHALAGINEDSLSPSFTNQIQTRSAASRAAQQLLKRDHVTTNTAANTSTTSMATGHLGKHGESSSFKRHPATNHHHAYHHHHNHHQHIIGKIVKPIPVRPISSSSSSSTHSSSFSSAHAQQALNSNLVFNHHQHHQHHINPTR